MKNTKRRPRRGPVTPPSQRPEPTAQPRPGPAHDRRTWLVAIPMVLVVAAAFLPTLGNGFLNWDDEGNFLENSYYRGLGWPQLRWAWTTFLLGVYQPVAWMLLEAQYAAFGLDPRGYHLTSLLLHAAVAAALYALTTALLARRRPDPVPGHPWAHAAAGLATALFMVHPLRVEAVAWASCQPYLPCALFSILAALAYLRAVDDGPSPRRPWLAASLLLFVAAMLSKAAAVGLPAVLMILDVYPLRRAGGGPGRWLGPEARRVWLEKLPFVAISLVFMALAVAAKAEVHTLVPLQNDGVPARIAQACYGTWFYIVKTLLPLDIAAFYPLPTRIDWFAPAFLASIVATLAVSVGLFLMRRRRPGLLAAWLSYLVLLAPSSGLVRIGTQLAADRYSYLPMMGGVVLLAAGLGRFWSSARRTPAVAVAVVAGAAVLGLAALTWDQCRVWRTSETLWSHALQHGGDSSMAHCALGSIRTDEGRLDEALDHYARAIRIDPGSAAARCGLGLVRFNQGRYEEAIDHLEEAIRLNPDDPEAHHGLGWALARRGRYEEAIPRLEEAIRLKPDYAEAHYAMGSALSSRGRYREAIDHLEEAIRLKPDYAEAHNDRAMILASCPDPGCRDGREAVASATRACELTGWKQPSCLDTLAAASAEAGDLAGAVARQEQAIALLPDGPTRDGYRARLALYRAGKPFRAPTPAPAPAGGGP